MDHAVPLTRGLVMVLDEKTYIVKTAAGKLMRKYISVAMSRAIRRYYKSDIGLSTGGRLLFKAC